MLQFPRDDSSASKVLRTKALIVGSLSACLFRRDERPRLSLLSSCASQLDETVFQLKTVIGAPSMAEFIVRLFLPRSRANTLVALQVRLGPFRLKAMLIR